MKKLNDKEAYLISGGSYFTSEEYAETLYNWGVVPAVMLGSTCGLVAFSIELNCLAMLSMVGVGGVLGYLGGSYTGAALNSDPDSRVLYGVFVDTYKM
ncbi:hypothetical protein [Candidatus Berkiella aquae]|uniref:Uncharacterized protein n=1 Tax=Candidatus Berkiella aquae TaxID=295108 RepID=A0A0Q9YPG7_9GAMM|nr:hypothetical protein [Candidatus Berkiella aquae]MCS5711967.1 hypothetical protein [Candidatus Berkiella aquae]